MKSFSTRVSLIFCSSFVALSFAQLAAVLAFFYVALLQSEKRELDELAHRIEAELQGPGGHHGPGDNIDGVVSAINEKIAFLFDEDDLNLGYAIFGKDGNKRYDYFSPHAQNPFTSVRAGSGQLYFRRWSGHNACTFYRRLSGRRYDLLVSSAHHFELIDTMLAGLAVVLPVGILIAIFLGRALSRRVVDPMNKIAATARRVEHGDLGARIENLPTGDEVEYVVNVLNATLEKLQTSFERIQQFSADVAHEFKTPLTAMRGDMEVSLRKPRSAEEYQATLARCIEEIADLNRFIESLLVLATPDEGRARQRFRTVDLGELLGEVQEHLEAFAETQNVRLETTGDGAATVLGDRALLHQLLYNLVHNAIKFSSPGDIVKVSSTCRQGDVQIEVVDSGCGIPEEHVDKIFDRLYQADSSRNVGHGLGLAIVKWIAELHRGAISVQSLPGEGSSFTVRLPTQSSGKLLAVGASGFPGRVSFMSPWSPPSFGRRCVAGSGCR
ncbi:MAG: ATP-binding protein [Verrucomicrobia bacterium]|nr:ATP-binding protein [Verrucomicrobiota bacterium]